MCVNSEYRPSIGAHSGVTCSSDVFRFLTWIFSRIILGRNWFIHDVFLSCHITRLLKHLVLCLLNESDGIRDITQFCDTPQLSTFICLNMANKRGRDWFKHESRVFIDMTRSSQMIQLFFRFFLIDLNLFCTWSWRGTQPIFMAIRPWVLPSFLYYSFFISSIYLNMFGDKHAHECCPVFCITLSLFLLFTWICLANKHEQGLINVWHYSTLLGQVTWHASEMGLHLFCK